MLTFQQSPDSFFVEEKLAYEPAGEGDHLFAQIRKQGIPTHLLKRRLSEAMGIPLRLIRHAGKKDAAATATQWLSWPKEAQKVPGWPSDTSSYKVLRFTNHSNGLAVGHVKSNAFELVLEATPDMEMDMAGGIVFPNYYGTQRFGNGPRQWHEWMSPKSENRLKKDSVSVVQALLFNAFLAKRINDTGQQIFDDDYWMQAMAKRFFQTPVDEEIEARFQRGEISPSGPIFGYKVPLRGAETTFLEGYRLVQDSFRAWGKAARGTRRPLWVKPAAFSADWHSDKLKLAFELPSGAYATVFLLHLFSPQILAAPMESWPNLTEEVTWQRGDHGFELAVV